MTKTKKIYWMLISALIVGMLIIAFACISLVRTREFASEVKADVQSQRTNKDDKLLIGLIGDSWVYGTKLGPYIEENLKGFGYNAEVISSGHPGATSKQIYQNLFLPESEATSSRRILLNQDIDYCVVVAGINDSAGYLGADYYAYHMCAIAKTLLEHGIVPVVVELPEYGIELLEPYSFRHAVKLWLLRTLFNRGEVNVIDEYRSELVKMLNENGLQGKICIVDFDQFVSDFSLNRHFYEDLLHINDLGRKELAKCIAKEITNIESKKQ